MTQPATDFGTCWSCVDDLSSPARIASGFQVVAEAVLRRWSTSPGDLIDDPAYGFNVSDLISDDLSARDISQAQQQMTAEAEKDERVQSCDVVLTLDVAGVVKINATIDTAAGPFTLVASVSAMSVKLLQVQP